MDFLSYVKKEMVMFDLGLSFINLPKNEKLHIEALRISVWQSRHRCFDSMSV